jgi:hypothetical protein
MPEFAPAEDGPIVVVGATGDLVTICAQPIRRGAALLAESHPRRSGVRINFGKAPRGSLTFWPR